MKKYLSLFILNRNDTSSEEVWLSSSSHLLQTMDNFEKYRGGIYDFSDTSKMRGTWFKMLIDASKADRSSREEKMIVCGQIRTLCEYFQCLKCKTHFSKRLISNPPEVEIDKRDGLFIWTVEFANAVSTIKNKELYDMKIIYPMFHSGEHVSCDTGCDNNKATQPGEVKFSSSRNRREPRQKTEDVQITYSEGDKYYRRPSYEEVL